MGYLVMPDGNADFVSVGCNLKASALVATAQFASIQYVGGVLKLTDTQSTPVSSIKVCSGTDPVYTFTDGAVATSTAADLTTAVTGKTAVLSYASDNSTITGIYIF